MRLSCLPPAGLKKEAWKKGGSLLRSQAGESVKFLKPEGKKREIQFLRPMGGMEGGKKRFLREALPGEKGGEDTNFYSAADVEKRKALHAYRRRDGRPCRPAGGEKAARKHLDHG